MVAEIILNVVIIKSLIIMIFNLKILLKKVKEIEEKGHYNGKRNFILNSK